MPADFVLSLAFLHCCTAVLLFSALRHLLGKLKSLSDLIEIRMRLVMRSSMSKEIGNTAKQLNRQSIELGSAFAKIVSLLELSQSKTI